METQLYTTEIDQMKTKPTRKIARFENAVALFFSYLKHAAELTTLIYLSNGKSNRGQILPITITSSKINRLIPSTSPMHSRKISKTFLVVFHRA